MTKSKSIRTLFITGYTPYPPIGGAPLRNWQNISLMMKFGSVAIFSISHQIDEKHHSEYPPGVALWSHHQVKHTPRKRSFWQKVEWWLQPRKHFTTDSLYTDTISQELDQVLTEFQPNLIIFAEIGLYSYLTIVKNRECCLILDNHNVEASLFLDNQSSSINVKSKLLAKILFNKIKSIERDFICKVNQVWMCSEADSRLLNKMYGQHSHIHVIPNGIDVAYYDCVRLGDCSLPSELKQIPLTLFFAGTFSYLPNQVAAQLLIEQIFPQLQGVYPECRLILAGKSPTATMLEAAKQNPGIIVTGLVEDMRPYMLISSVVIVPLLQGGGTRLKILEAFAAGRPVVSTTKGAEGLKVQDGKHLLIRNSIEELVAGVHKLWSAPCFAEALADNAYELVKTEYSWESVGKRIDKSVLELLHD